MRDKLIYSAVGVICGGLIGAVIGSWSILTIFV